MASSTTVPSTAGDYFVQAVSGVDTFYPVTSRKIVQGNGAIENITSSQLILGQGGGGGGGGGGGDGDPVLLGLSAVVASDTSIHRTGDVLHAKGAYQYWTSVSAADWSKVPALFPNDWPWHIAAPMGFTLAQYRAMLATFPATHGANVYVSGGQEKSNDPPYRTGTGKPYVYNGALYISDTAPLRQAIYEARAAGKTYIIPSVSLLTQDIYAVGSSNDYVDSFIATAGRDPNPVMHLMMSAYAGSKTKNGHQVAVHDPVVHTKRLGDFAKSRGLAWDASATAFSMPLAYMSDPISIQNRVDWWVTFVHEAVKNGAHFFGWFNSESNDPDWLVQDDPKLLAAWLQLAQEYGQYTP